MCGRSVDSGIDGSCEGEVMKQILPSCETCHQSPCVCGVFPVHRDSEGTYYGYPVWDPKFNPTVVGEVS